MENNTIVTVHINIRQNHATGLQQISEHQVLSYNQQDTLTNLHNKKSLSEQVMWTSLNFSVQRTCCDEKGHSTTLSFSLFKII